jgi:molybdopterin-binding protein
VKKGIIKFFSKFKKIRRKIMKLSARNQLKGKVVSINNGAVNSIVSIDIGGGNIIVATISCAAVEELGLEVGSDAYAVIKATNVMVGIDE